MDVSVVLKNGERVKVNDHVYSSPTWAVRDGTPYSVARIMEFLPSEGNAKGKGKGKETYTRVRLAWYYRPSDVSDRAVADSRLLLAAIYSEVCEINHLRSKCFVVHKDKIHDLAGWKKRPDRFYFNRLFDPYIKKEFEVILSRDVRNLPTHIREVLLSRYEYVVTEKEVVPDLTDALRLCETCGEWCPSPESVQCDGCKNYFHMSCVQPPLIAKPSRGYGWTCAPCSRQHDDDVDNHQIVRNPAPPPPKPKSNAPPARGRGRPRKDRSLLEKDEHFEVKYFKMWPFRYFGQYTVAEDTLDPDDLIFPRIATRIGPKYQATVPVFPSADEGAVSGLEDRGGDSTIEVLSIINELSDAEVAEVERLKALLTNRKDLQSSVDWLTEVIRRFSVAYQAGQDFSTVNMKNPLRLEKWKRIETRYADREWNDEEVGAFEDSINAHGPELRAVRDEVGTRTIYEVVRFYTKWKNSKLREENIRYAMGGIDASTKPDAVDLSSRSRSSEDPEEGSMISDSSPLVHICGACRTRDSSKWWKAPKFLDINILCDSCGLSWRKYGDLNSRSVREDTVLSGRGKGGEKREGTPLTGPLAKRIKTSGPSSTPTPPPQTASARQPRPSLGNLFATPPPLPTAPQLSCLCCGENGPIGKVLKCKQCSFQAHAAACGAVLDGTSADSWTCEICRNEKTLEASLNTDCVLCPRTPLSEKKKTLPYDPPPDSFLRACKPTEGQVWVHVLCSIFIPEISYTNAARLRLVEGVSGIPTNRWTSKCHLCDEEGGAVVRCCHCPQEYHVSCAWKWGQKFGFRIQPVKGNRRDAANTTIVSFLQETGAMNAVISCKDHVTRHREIYDICEMNEVGETALQVYCRLYKQAPITKSHGLLRKAERLDRVLHVPVNEGSSSEGPDSTTPECDQCHTAFSPFYHPNPSIVDSRSSQNGATSGWLCHKCYFRLTPRSTDAIIS